jgi:hypothetical protein
MLDPALLQAVKERVWFYEFDLPDGTKTRTDIPAEVIRIHESRRIKLEQIIRDRVSNPGSLTALDFASHEGFYSIELAKHFKSVQGLEIRSGSIEAARLITHALGVGNVAYSKADLQRDNVSECLAADFVLLYGLLYHVENPVHTLRLAANLSRRHILIETQVLPYDISGLVEDGHYVWQRQVHGVFGITTDYQIGREGGSTDIALVPSLSAVLFLLRTFGFKDLEVLDPLPGDYEQFRRRSRVVVYGSK